MRFADVNLLVKKVIVGVVIAAIPLFILIGGLHLTRAVLERQPGDQVPVPAQPNVH
jgi:surface polysaccharide O-acyltransferase-like enzyme